MSKCPPIFASSLGEILILKDQTYDEAVQSCANIDGTLTSPTTLDAVEELRTFLNAKCPEDKWYRVGLLLDRYHKGTWANGQAFDADRDLKRLFKHATIFSNQDTEIVISSQYDHNSLFMLQVDDTYPSLCTLPPPYVPSRFTWSVILSITLSMIYVLYSIFQLVKICREERRERREARDEEANDDAIETELNQPPQRVIETTFVLETNIPRPKFKDNRSGANGGRNDDIHRRSALPNGPVQPQEDVAGPSWASHRPVPSRHRDVGRSGVNGDGVDTSHLPGIGVLRNASAQRNQGMKMKELGPSRRNHQVPPQMTRQDPHQMTTEDPPAESSKGKGGTTMETLGSTSMGKRNVQMLKKVSKELFEIAEVAQM